MLARDAASSTRPAVRSSRRACDDRDRPPPRARTSAGARDVPSSTTGRRSTLVTGWIASALRSTPVKGTAHRRSRATTRAHRRSWPGASRTSLYPTVPASSRSSEAHDSARRLGHRRAHPRRRRAAGRRRAEAQHLEGRRRTTSWGKDSQPHGGGRARQAWALVTPGRSPARRFGPRSRSRRAVRPRVRRAATWSLVEGYKSSALPTVEVVRTGIESRPDVLDLVAARRAFSGRADAVAGSGTRPLRPARTSPASTGVTPPAAAARSPSD